MTGPVANGLLGSVIGWAQADEPVLRPSAEQARQWLQEELASPEYAEPWLARIQRWLDRLLSPVVEGLGSGAGIVLVVIVAAALLLLMIVVLPRIRSSGRRASLDDPGLGVLGQDAAHYRQLAARALADGNLEAALTQAFRAIAVTAGQRGLIALTPQHTAQQVARELSVRLPADQPRIGEAANQFDAVRYGGAHPDRASVQAVMDLETDLRTAQPQLTGEAARVLAVPR